MKKVLLSAAALVAAMSMNAQVLQLDSEALGFGEEAVDVEAGFEWGTIEGALEVTNAFATGHKAVDSKIDDFNKVIIDGNEILTKGGVQGQDNPKDADGTGVAVSLKEPVSGAVIALNALKNGWVYIVAKLSTNKQYVVFEEGSAMGYKIAMESNDARVEGGVINLEFQGEGEYNYMSTAMEEYATGLPWVIRKYLNDPEAETAGNGLGVFYFPVAEGCKYLASASGSKIMWCGIYFSETEAASVVVAGDEVESRAIVGSADAAVKGIQTVEQFNGAKYNLAGQKVAANFKGMTVQNGRKFMVK